MLTSRFAAIAFTSATLVALAGCGEGAPPVSSSTAEATVHGTVTYKGKPVTEGEIRFDPTNVQRRNAPIVTAPIGKDGTYSVKTLVGENSVSFILPALTKSDPSLAYATLQYTAPGGDSTYDVQLPPNQP